MKIHLFYTNNKKGGPGKVIKNLRSGLDLLGVTYSVNTPYDQINDEDKLFCLQENDSLKTPLSKRCVVGPNICVIPPENKAISNGNYKKIVVPSEWIKKMWSPWVADNDMVVWPVGVDTEEFKPSDEEKTLDCILYYKNRDGQDLNKCESFLQDKDMKYVTIQYGTYNEEDFKFYMRRCKFCFMLDNTESQGLATLEILSSGLPIFVWETTTLINPHYPQIRCDATSVPYWDDRCGMKYFGGNQLQNKFNQFLNDLNSYNPRQYVKENLDLMVQAQKLIEL